jgi:SAM-dependent methyltransferase
MTSHQTGVTVRIACRSCDSGSAPVRLYWGMCSSVTAPDHVSTARAVYDATAEAYAKLVGTELTPVFEGPIDRAMLSAFVEYLTTSTAGPVADVGCGPGRVAAFLAANGVEVIGVDVSPTMLAVAREAHPAIRFYEGRLTAVPVSDHSLAGAVCWYSIIHTPPHQLDKVFAELKRALTHEGYLLVAFQAGDGDRVHRADAYGTGLPLTNYQHSADDVGRQMDAVGLRVLARAEREPDLRHETTRQAFLVARAYGPAN